MNILEEIILNKRNEVAQRKELYPVKLLEQSIYFETKPVSFRKYILRKDLSGIIAEFKRKSPSKGHINKYASVEKVTLGYMMAGASALSVLTDKKYFGGENADLTTARKFNYCPILRKDFIIDEYQILEAKSIGADVILLIAACLSPVEIKRFSLLARSLGMEVLLEVHGKQELDENLIDTIDAIGVNNRDLKTFKVDIRTSLNLAEEIPPEYLKISESGINEAENILELKNAGFNGFLVGETFMKTANPERACKQFIEQINKSAALKTFEII